MWLQQPISRAHQHERDIHVQCLGQSLDVVDRDIALCALERADVGAVQAREVGQSLLR